MRRACTLAFILMLALPGLALVTAPAQAASATAIGELPVALVGASAVPYGGATYIFGGRLESNDYSDAVYRYDHATGAVSKVATMPATGGSLGGGRYAGAAAELGGKIYYFGGATQFEADINGDGTSEKVPKASKDILEFDPASGTVREALDDLPGAIWGVTGASLGGRIYLFGGFTFDVTNLAATARHDWIIKFDPERAAGTRAVQLQTRLPYEVQDAAIAASGGRIYVIGGLSSHDNATNACPTFEYQGETRQNQVCISRNILPFDVASETPRPDLIAEMPYRVQYAAATSLDRRVYVAGALLVDGSASSSIVAYDPESGAVAAIPPTLPTGAFGSAVSVADGNVLLFGGRTGGQSELTRSIVKLDPSASTPFPPRSAKWSNITGGGIRLEWDEPAYDGGSIVTDYKVYRNGTDGVETLLATTKLLTFDDTTAKPGAPYVYRITALNAKGESATSARVSTVAQQLPPGKVEGFQVYADNGRALIRWQAPLDDGGANVTGYRIFRDGQLVTTAAPSLREHTDQGLTNGQTYEYSIRAYNAKGDGPLSAGIRVTPADVPPAPTQVVAIAQETAVSLSWEPPAEGGVRYIVYRGVAPGVVEPITAEPLASPQFVDEGVQRGKTYYYTVASVRNDLVSPPSSEASVSLVRTPGAPRDVLAMGLEGQVRLTWRAPEDAGDADPATLAYYVSRASPGSASRIIATDIKGLAYSDKSASPGVAYTYTVTTLNPKPSAPSAAVEATARQLVNQAPSAQLALLPSIATIGEPVTLDASQSVDNDGVIRSYVFDFGDGTDPVRTESPTVTHSYPANGSYTATVVVTDERNEPSQPASARIVIGELEGRGEIDTGLNLGGKTDGPGKTSTDGRPGTSTPRGIPAPGVAAAFGALALVAFALRRR